MYGNKPNASVGVERTPKRKSRKKLDRLTRDAIAAQEAGMSYGQYKALHPHTPDEDDEKDREIDPDSVVAVCEFCGDRFIKRKNQTAKRFCGATCQNRYNHHKNMEKKRQAQIGRTATCATCGATFTLDWGNRKYCSPECFAEGQRKRAQERRAQQREKEAAENGTN